MPEGDTVRRAAERLSTALVGATIEKVGGSHRAILRDGRRLSGQTVTSVESVGKHLILEVDRGWALRTHLGMSGSWHLYRPGERWRRSPGAARVVLETADAVAVCFAAPSVEVAPTDRIRQGVAHLGPDAIGDGFDETEALGRATALPGGTVANDVILSQSVLAGVGNVFANEILHLEGIHPETPRSALSEEQILGLIRRAHRLLRANRRGGARVTTGSRSRGAELWVYGRAGHGCRRCGTTLVEGLVGKYRRVTTWCPSCQPTSST